MNLKHLLSALLFILSLFSFPNTQARTKDLIKLDDLDKVYNSASQKEDKPKKNGIFSIFKNKKLNFFPVPVFETRPDKGQSYGAMPVLLFSDKDTQAISIILAAIIQWNTVVKVSGAAIMHLFPNPNTNPEETLEIFLEFAQKFYRETTIRYFNPKINDDFYFESIFTYLRTPFPRFYGFGAGSPKSGISNYKARSFLFDTTFGYYLLKNFRINLTEKFTTTDLQTRAFTNEADTLTLYGGLPGVADATNLIHKISLTYDTRPHGVNSKKGTFLEAGYFFSIKDVLSDNTFNGYTFEATQLIPFFKERTITALRFYIQDMYGTAIPFYLQSSLGGDKELRAFLPNRFTDTGKVMFTLEQRFKVFGTSVFGVPVELYADPFFELGRVFHHLNNFNFKNLQPVGGLGIRGVVPPNVVGRLDLAVGREGFEIYTMLGYPF